MRGGEQAVDVAVASTTCAAERMKKVLTAPDKKEMIREMAEVSVGVGGALRAGGGG